MTDNADVPYSNRELDEWRKDVAASLGRIEAQTIKTNGRVTSMERWRSFITGGMAILTVMVLPMLTWAILQIVDLPQTLHVQVQAAVQDALVHQAATK